MITDHFEMKGILQKVSQTFPNARKQFYPDSSSQYVIYAKRILRLSYLV